jgi:hypothetical protein
MPAWLLLLGALAAGQATRSPTPTPAPSPPPAETLLQYVHVLLDGVPAEGTVVSGEGGRTLFQACLPWSDSRYGSRVQAVLLHFDLPGLSPLAPRRTAFAILFDDGTHGDDVAGDGLYQLLDADDSIGCGRAFLPAGTYAYVFQCVLRDGRPCGQKSVRVDRR